MGRFILRFTGKGEKPAGDVARVRAHKQVKIIDDTARMLLVEAPLGALERLMSDLADWHLAPEQMLRLPDPRPRIDEQD